MLFNKLCLKLWQDIALDRVATAIFLLYWLTNKEMADYFSSKGFAVAVQDVRGRMPSGGKWEPAVHEGEDGYDTAEWLAAQGWSNGKVGTVGASYDGWIQFLTALAHPSYLLLPIVDLRQFE